MWLLFLFSLEVSGLGRGVEKKRQPLPVLVSPLGKGAGTSAIRLGSWSQEFSSFSRPPEPAVGVTGHKEAATRISSV